MREKQLNLWEFQQVTTRFAPSADGAAFLDFSYYISVFDDASNELVNRTMSFLHVPSNDFPSCFLTADRVFDDGM